jgi:hypothetical protein
MRILACHYTAFNRALSVKETPRDDCFDQMNGFAFFSPGSYRT